MALGAGDGSPGYVHRLGAHLGGVARCPYCGVANPVLELLWRSAQRLVRATPGPTAHWAAYRCTSCGSVVLAKGKENDDAQNAPVAEVIPSPKTAHEDIPEPARTYLQQAETLRAPDAAAMVSGSAVDAMLKELGYSEGSVYSRIDKAVEDHHLTAGMGAWAHEVRLGSNRPRHADAANPHVTPAQAEQSVEFAEALGYFLFVLTKRIERGTEAATRVGGL
jgi:DNA-directed RNA polymerase subunit RPC12/RpoP